MNLERVMGMRFPVLEQSLTPRDCMLYALGIGLGSAPDDRRELRYVYEDRLAVFPSMVNVIAHPSGWAREPELGIDWVKLLHGEQAFTLHRPLNPTASYAGHFRVVGVLDKGKSSVLLTSKELRDMRTDELVSTVTVTYVLRGSGGFGSTMAEPQRAPALPERPPDHVTQLGTLPQAALLYRLSGDFNPIHADPDTARKAGFAKPILHGLCTLGVATRALLQEHCALDPEGLKSLAVRFTAPLYPGESLTIESWRDRAQVRFRGFVAERHQVVLDSGTATFRG
jgi:acyl dehydratase